MGCLKLLTKYICGSDCETFLNKYFNALKDGFMFSELIRDSHGIPISLKILEVNNAFEEMFEVNKEFIIGSIITPGVFPAFDQEWLTLCGQVIQNGTSIQKDIHFKITDKHFRVNIISQNREQFIVLFHDITELIKADEVLKKHYMLFEYAKDIIFYLRSNGSIIDANKTAVDRYGYTKEELLNMYLQQLRHPSTMRDYNEQMKESALNGLTFESIHVGKDGTCFPVEVSSRTLDISGEQIRFHIVRDITERKKNEEKIKHFADYDTLTGIYNRGFLMYQFRKLLEKSQLEKRKFAVMLFDIDKFKIINDTYGHNAGDEVLIKVSERLREIVGESVIIGRLGGDEFLVVQPFIEDKNDALELSQKILDCVAKPVEWEGYSLDVHISIGISFFPDSSDNIKGLIHCADCAMYNVKQNGGNSFSY